MELIKLDLELLVQEVAGLAKQTMKKDGYHIPLVIAFKNQAQHIIKIPAFKNASEKNKSFQEVNNILRNLRPVCFVVIMEGWGVRLEGKDYNVEKHIPPSEHPDRYEVLSITGKQPDRTFALHFPVIRKDNSIDFGKPDVWDTRKDMRTEDRFCQVFADVH